MDFESVFAMLIDRFQKEEICFALMGGFAMHACGYSRSTEDIDMLVLNEDMPKVKKIMGDLGYESLHESGDVSNFKGKLRELGRVDFLHAHRHYTKNMLQRAKGCCIFNGKRTVKVLLPEDIIGLKVQSSANDPDRHHRDMADIEALMRCNAGQLDLNLIREYFALFAREDELNAILKRLNSHAQ